MHNEKTMSVWRDDFPTTKNPLKFLWFSSRPHLKFALFAFCGVTAAATLYALIPYVFKLITNAALKLPHQSAYFELLLAAGAYIVVSVSAQLFWRFSGFQGSQWATGARATARHALTNYVTFHSRSYFSDRFAGSIANKIGHASNGMRELVERLLWQFWEFTVSITVSFIIAFLASPLLGAMFLVWISTAAIINFILARRRIPLSVETQAIETHLNGTTVDLFSNVTAMQDYAQRSLEIERLKTLIDRRRASGLRNWHYGERVLVYNGIFQALFGGAMVFASVYLAHVGAISSGDIVLTIAMIFRVEGLVLSLGSHINGFGETWGTIVESLTEILEPHEIPDAPDASQLIVSRGTLSFERVRFAHYGNQIFGGLSLTIRSGERVGLVGRSGAGKSTLIRLLLHHHNIQSGRITIDGQDISQVTQESLRRAISVVPQEPVLFHRSIAENIAYGNPDATSEEILNAAKAAYAHDFIEKLPEGYNTLVGERGVKLSGGERQRIAVARAILKNAPILLLDEATSALDSESEIYIQQALHSLMRGKTVIAIAHRLSTLREMDRIIVLDNGTILEEGTHASLVQNSGTYAQLWQHQAGGFVNI